MQGGSLCGGVSGMWSVVGYVILYFIMLLYLLYYKYVLFSNMYYVIYCKLHYITLVSPRFRDTLHPSICTVVVGRVDGR